MSYMKDATGFGVGLIVFGCVSILLNTLSIAMALNDPVAEIGHGLWCGAGVSK